jgi:hypothetical protein
VGYLQQRSSYLRILLWSWVCLFSCKRRSIEFKQEIYVIQRNIMNHIVTTKVILSCRLFITLLREHFPKGFQQNSVGLYIPCRLILATCPAHRSLLDFTGLTILGDLRKLQSSALCNILNLTFVLTFLGPNIFLSTFVSNTCSACSSHKWETTFHTHTK